MLKPRLSWSTWWLAWCLVGCQVQKPENEHHYTIYIETSAQHSQTAQDTVKAPTDLPSNLQPVIQVNPEVEALKKKMLEQGLLMGDLPQGDETFKQLTECRPKLEKQKCQDLLNGLNQTVDATKIDAEFIAKKNNRLLALIQETKPDTLTQQKIDKTSTEINQLMEKEDYTTINRYLNELFEILQKTKPH